MKSGERIEKMLDALDVLAEAECKREITHVVFHCTGGAISQTRGQVMAEFKRKGWKNPGYHLLVDKWGTPHRLLSDDKVANGAKGYNSHSIHIAWTGGRNKEDIRTPYQILALEALARMYHKKFPNAKFCGHRDLSPDLNKNGEIEPCEWVKRCPMFDVKKEYQDIINS